MRLFGISEVLLNSQDSQDSQDSQNICIIFTVVDFHEFEHVKCTPCKYFLHLLDTDNYLIPNCSFQLYLRLFLVMGLTYSISALSFLISRSSTFTEWTEIFLSLQGVWIFLLFVLKRRILHLIKERCVCALKNVQHSNRTVATTYIWSVCFVDEFKAQKIIKLVFIFYFF